MKSIRNFFKASGEILLLFAFVLIAGCASIGAAPAQSFSEQLAYGYGGVAAIRTTCAQQLAAQAISVPAAQKCLADTDAVRATLDAAQTSSANGDQSTAVAKLSTATAILTQLQIFLTNKGK
jgi:hypothetical protein